MCLWGSCRRYYWTPRYRMFSLVGFTRTQQPNVWPLVADNLSSPKNTQLAISHFAFNGYTIFSRRLVRKRFADSVLIQRSTLMSCKNTRRCRQRLEVLGKHQVSFQFWILLTDCGFYPVSIRLQIILLVYIIYISLYSFPVQATEGKSWTCTENYCHILMVITPLLSGYYSALERVRLPFRHLMCLYWIFQGSTINYTLYMDMCNKFSTKEKSTVDPVDSLDPYDRTYRI